MPPLLTFIARQSDGLPLVASFAPTTENLEIHKKQAKEVVRNLKRSVSKMSIETTQSKIFHYLVQQNMVFLTLTEQSYPKRLAFLYLEEIADVFIEHLSTTASANSSDYIQTVETTARPYAFIHADPIIQRKQRSFVDPKSTTNTSKLSQDLSDIHSIMRQNINQVLDRGEKLENVSQISSNLMSESKKFKWGAKKLSWWTKVNTYAPVVTIVLCVIVIVYLKFFY